MTLNDILMTIDQNTMIRLIICMYLLDFMVDLGFLTAPASGGNHLPVDGGLLEHTVNVMQLAEKIGVKNDGRLQAWTYRLCGNKVSQPFSKKYG